MESDRPSAPVWDGWVLLGANLLTLGIALWREWGLLPLLWPYWIQSVLVGLFAWLRIRAAQRRSVGLALEAGHFAAHYGFGHLVYLGFLILFTSLAAADGYVEGTSNGRPARWFLGTISRFDAWLFVLLAAAFAWAQLGEYFRQTDQDLFRPPTLKSMTTAAYLRVVPMHMTLILGVALGGGATAVVLFAVLKTVVDLQLHRHARKAREDEG